MPIRGWLLLSTCFLVLLLASAGDLRSTSLSFGPVIGIMAQPVGKDTPGSFIEAWYTKWLEANGARIVPLRYDAPSAELEGLMERVNGVLLPGGGSSIIRTSHYGRASAAVFDIALKMRMPVWGTCLGFEQLLLYSSGQQGSGPLSSGFDAESLFLPINFTASAKHVSTLLQDWPQDLYKAAARNPWSWHNHQAGVSPEDFARIPELGKFWHVLATNKDRKGREFVSLVEAKDGLPFFGSQFHPEKNANEFELPENVSVNGSLPVHSSEAIAAMSHLAAFFVDQTRKFRSFGFTAEEFWKWSIATWPLQIVGRLNATEWGWLPPHMQVHYFPPWTGASSNPGLGAKPMLMV